MKNKQVILQVGSQNLRPRLNLPESVEWVYLTPDAISTFALQEKTVREENKQLKKANKPLKAEMRFAAILLTDPSYPASLWDLSLWAEAHAVLIPHYLQPENDILKDFLQDYMAQKVDVFDLKNLETLLSKGLFTGQYGAKMPILEYDVSERFQGDFSYQGNRYLLLDGQYARDFQEIARFRYNIPYEQTQLLDLWLEYQVSSSVDLRMVVQLIPAGATSDITQEWVFTQADMAESVEIDADLSGNLAVSIQARGVGQLKLGPLHYRLGRHGLGEFILGGERFADETRQEFMSYFHPGDGKPPLNVYFSGFKTAEGFEGYWMMKSMGAPFLLITDPRIEGGAFYLGGASYEKAIRDCIQDKMDFLGFEPGQLILSGLSMGTFGALYYGAQLPAHAVIVGKPLVNLGNMASNERLNRPNGFPTSLDLLASLMPDQSQASVQGLNQRFWSVFDQAKWQQTILAIAYMRDDDYDGQAFQDLVNHTKGKPVKIIGKGWLGRHNDNSPAIVNWFVTQYHNILRQDFERDI
ncbi:accessory Sec system protein Asp2 [Streptococcus sp. DD12]|uniref:accessory Sec system protein Asp2 n=1 Tax=Streptococcus sp. DD12 TaxID=1777880 RepID=UPI00079667EE|nr:accessory Sec system protein Asp2 [Streptococcus sp. DD12]KXT76157.1 Accessory secretory protein Asp2 [Streptococcus sp. DD12]